MGASDGASVGASVGGTTGAMGAGVGGAGVGAGVGGAGVGAGVGGTGTGNLFPFFFDANLRGRPLGTDAAASGVASMTEAAAAACSETKENKASE